MLRVSFINEVIATENLDLIEKYELHSTDGLNYTNCRIFALPDSFAPHNLCNADSFDILALRFNRDFYLIPGVYNVFCTNVNPYTIPDQTCMH